MRIIWEAPESESVPLAGGQTLETLLRQIFAQVPREHLKGIEAVYAFDTDPKGARLGVYVRDHLGTRIELFLLPHVHPFADVPEPGRTLGLARYLAHTLFHEVGHHLTLTLNPRRKPSGKRGAVSDTLEKWAEQYVERRMEKFVLPELAPPP